MQQRRSLRRRRGCSSNPGIGWLMLAVAEDVAKGDRILYDLKVRLSHVSVCRCQDDRCDTADKDSKNSKDDPCDKGKKATGLLLHQNLSAGVFLCLC